MAQPEENGVPKSVMTSEAETLVSMVQRDAHGVASSNEVKVSARMAQIHLDGVDKTDIVPSSLVPEEGPRGVVDTSNNELKVRTSPKANQVMSTITDSDSYVDVPPSGTV